MTTPFHVLVVEDDPDVAEFVKLVLVKRAGMQVDVAGNADKAFNLLQENEFDAMITDIEMPGASGLDLIARIRGLRPLLPIVVMTAHASVDYAITALRHAADEFLTKPIAAAHLVERMTALAQRGRTDRLSAAGQVVLAIGAHPDDVEIGVGGLLAAHQAGGDSIVILTMSRGDRGGDPNDRQHESLASADLLGARLFLEDLVDTRIEPADPTVSIIERVVAEVSPTIVYTHSSHDRHQDHRAVHQATTVATRRVPTVACYQSPSATVDFHPNRFVPIDGFTEAKIQLLACFASQSDVRAYLETDFVLATARYWSRFGGGRSCEPLEVIRDTSVIGKAWTPSRRVPAHSPGQAPQ
ncbi:LmbE family N-acetylglucosaminyl deacetylase/CheY-like chemotaxis protein [Nakamurella sp. UYEF19]|uniref:response regulator n=1 Tax=Nakamurella sp. UYEF19 TaxID=1756392 RepID=UPI0033914AF9